MDFKVPFLQATRNLLLVFASYGSGTAV